MAESLAEFFLTTFRAHRDERAYGQRRGYRTEWFTYGQVLGMAFQFCRELEARGIGKGERVMLWGENCAEWVAAFFGCALCGVIAVPMDDGASADFAARVARQVEARLCVCSRKHVRHMGVADVAPCLVLEDLSQIADGRPALPSDVKLTIRGDDTLQIVFTSGTTADPRGVVITHGNVLANIAPLEREMQGYLKYERWVHPVRFLNLLPLSHVFGQFLGMFLPPLLGGTVIFQEEMKPSEIVNTIRRERVSVLVSVPRVLQSLKQKMERDLEDRGEIETFQRRFRAGERSRRRRPCGPGSAAPVVRSAARRCRGFRPPRWQIPSPRRAPGAAALSAAPVRALRGSRRSTGARGCGPSRRGSAGRRP